MPNRLVPHVVVDVPREPKPYFAAEHVLHQIFEVFARPSAALLAPAAPRALGSRDDGWVGIAVRVEDPVRVVRDDDDLRACRQSLAEHPEVSGLLRIDVLLESLQR
eukprot:2371200-Prymnesium_polylepis.1